MPELPSPSSPDAQEFSTMQAEALDATDLEPTPWPEDSVASFETERGSVYTYDENGRTTRFKTITGEQNEAQDLTVFADLEPDDAQQILRAYLRDSPDSDAEAKVYVLEQTEEGTGRFIRSRDEISDPGKLFLTTVKNGQVGFVSPATVFPKEGAYVYDTRHFKGEDGNSYTERHLGHRVSKINYK